MSADKNEEEIGWEQWMDRGIARDEEEALKSLLARLCLSKNDGTQLLGM